MIGQYITRKNGRSYNGWTSAKRLLAKNMQTLLDGLDCLFGVHCGSTCDHHSLQG